MSKNSSHDDTREKIRSTSIIVENVEVVSRYGRANAEFIKGYEGIDQETGHHFKGLKKISQSKVHPDYEQQNIKQQAGFSAEVNKVSRDNSRNIIERKSRQTIRTDDAPGFAANDTRHDHVELRAGKVVDGSGSQMKFVGDYKRLMDKIAMGDGGGKNDFSRYQGSRLDLPSEQVGPAKAYCRQQRDLLRQQAERLEQRGNSGLAEKRRQQARHFEELEKNCRDSGMTTDDAIFLREHPEWGTALEMGRVAHKAGLEGAYGGMLAGGLTSLCANILSVCKDQQDIDEAIGKIAQDVGKSAIMGYAGASVGSVAKAAMQQSDKALLRSISKTSFPGMIVSACVDITAVIGKLGNREIDIGEAIEELGQKGVSTYAGLWAGAVGQIAIPIPVVGAVVGGAIGYALSSLCFTETLYALRAARFEQERLERIRECSRAACRAMETYRQQLHDLFEAHFNHIRQECDASLSTMEGAVSVEDFSEGANRLALALHMQPRCGSFDDFQKMMANK